MRESAFLTAKTSAMVCWLFVGSPIFSVALALPYVFPDNGLWLPKVLYK